MYAFVSFINLSLKSVFKYTADVMFGNKLTELEWVVVQRNKTDHVADGPRHRDIVAEDLQNHKFLSLLVTVRHK